MKSSAAGMMHFSGLWYTQAQDIKVLFLQHKIHC